MNESKKISSENIVKIMKDLECGKSVNCPLCENGILQSKSGRIENENCFICDSCGSKLNID